MAEQIGQHPHLFSEMREVSSQIAAGEGNRDRGDAQCETLHRRRHRAGVQHILAHVLPVVDTAQHEVGALGHQRLHGEHHAIRRRTVHLPSLIAAPHGPNRMVEREGVTRGTLLAIGGNDDDFTERLGRLLKAL